LLLVFEVLIAELLAGECELPDVLQAVRGRFLHTGNPPFQEEFFFKSFTPSVGIWIRSIRNLLPDPKLFVGYGLIHIYHFGPESG